LRYHGTHMKVRWRICLLLFLTWVMSYVDRSLMPMALPLISQEFHLSPTVMGVVISAFFVGYASMQLPGGILADKFGPRKMMTAGVALWSIFSVLTGAVSSLTNLIWVRILFGLGEGIHPPAAFKTLSNWFNSSERGRASGLVMSSNTIGPMIAPLIFAVLMGAYGWRNAFFLISIPGFLIAIIVYWYLRDQPAEHPAMTARELAEIGEEKNRDEVSFREVLRYKALWQLFFIYMAWDVTWWGFQAWLPSYLLKERGFTLLATGAVAGLPYAAGFIGIVAAAFVSDHTRKPRLVMASVLLGNAVFMLLTATASNATTAVVFLTATGFFLPAIHGPFWSLVMDLLPPRVIGSASGFLNTGGQIAGIAAPVIIGALIELTGHYEAGFTFMALSAGVSAFLVGVLKESKARTVATSVVVSG
jgi:sugar phosphate permease